MTPSISPLQVNEHALPMRAGGVDLDGVTHLCIVEREFIHAWNEVARAYTPGDPVISATPHCWHWMPMFVEFEPIMFVEPCRTTCLYCIGVEGYTWTVDVTDLVFP